jgi:hypothetical protein
LNQTSFTRAEADLNELKAGNKTAGTLLPNALCAPALLDTTLKFFQS